MADKTVLTAAEQKRAQEKSEAKKAKMQRDLAKLADAQKEAMELKIVLKEKVTITKKGNNEGRTGVITNLLNDRNHVRMNVLLEGRSSDDPFGYEACNLRQVIFSNPAMVAKFGKAVKTAKDPARANKNEINKAVKRMRVSMKAGKAIEKADVDAIALAIVAWNNAPGKPVVAKEKAEKKIKK